MGILNERHWELQVTFDDSSPGLDRYEQSELEFELRRVLGEELQLKLKTLELKETK